MSFTTDARDSSARRVVNVLCKARGCYRITQRGRVWCLVCWRRLPKSLRAAIVRATAHLVEQPDDESAKRCRAAAMREARRALLGLRIAARWTE